MNILEYAKQFIDKYDIHITAIQGIEVTLSLAIAAGLAILAIILLICSLVSLGKHSKTKNFSGHADATFVSAEAYDDKKSKHLSKALIRYVVNEKSIVSRMYVPKNQRTADRLIVRYNTANPSEAVLIGDNSKKKKATVQFIFTLLVAGLAVLIYMA